jgi:hypothetical protein
MRLAKDAAANDYEKHIMAAEDVTLILLSQKSTFMRQASAQSARSSYG